MRKLACLAGVVVALVLAGPVALAADDNGGEAKPAKKTEKPKKEQKAKPAKEKSALTGEYGIMASVLKMDDTQKARLEEAVKANKAAVEQWKQGPQGQKLQELAKAMAEAKKADDKDKAKQIAQESSALKKEAAKLEIEGRQKIMGVLTDEQKAQWSAFRTERGILARFSKAELTDDQKAKIKQLCAEAVKSAPAGDEKAQSQANKKLMQEIEQNVLADAQREAMKKPKEGGDKTEKKPEKKTEKKTEKKPEKPAE